jgi:hypothetical protein
MTKKKKVTELESGTGKKQEAFPFGMYIISAISQET